MCRYKLGLASCYDILELELLYTGGRAGHDGVKTRLVELRAEQEFFFKLKLAFTSYYTRCMSGRRLRSGKIVGKAQKEERKRKTSLREEEEITKEESAMSNAILEELKCLRSDLTQQMQKICDELATFQGTTDTRLAKIESVISKIDEIDNLKPKVEKLEEDVADMKQSVNITLNETSNLFQECKVELQRVERLERYSRDFNIRVVGVAEQDGEDCLLIVRNYLTLLGFEEDHGEIENAHCTGRKREEKPRNIIVKLHSRPFKRVLLHVAKNQENKQALYGVRFVEDFTPYDFEIRKKALPIMKEAFDQGKKARFTRGKLFIDGKAVPVE